MNFVVEFFELSSEKIPVQEFLDSLEEKLRSKTVTNIQLLGEFGTELKKPFSKYIEEGIFELRTKQGSDIDRVLFFFREGKKIILTNGFVKKTDKIPKSELDLAKKYKKEYEKRQTT